MMDIVYLLAIALVNGNIKSQKDGTSLVVSRGINSAFIGFVVDLKNIVVRRDR